MDMSPGRTRARLAEAEDFLPGGNRWGQAVANPKRAQNNVREVICFGCNKTGHITRNCPHKQQQPCQQHQWQPRPGPSRNRQTEVNENHKQVRAVCDDCTPEQRAQDWLSNIVKELVMQQVLGGEGQDFLRRSNLMAWVRAIRCNTVYITCYRSMHVPVLIHTRYFMADKKALVDSRATDDFIHPAFAKRLGLAMMPLEKPKWIYNINNTSNKAGSITHSLELKVTTKGIDKIM